MRLRSIAYELYLVAMNFLLRVPSHAVRVLVLRRGCNNAVGQRAALERGITIYSKGGVAIGDDCNINAKVILDGRGGITIGSHVTIAPEVAILTADHDPQTPDFAGRCRAVTIGNDAWLATRALILPGSEIGEGSVVGAGAVVHGVVPEWTIVAGNPARHVANRSRDAGPPSFAYRRWFH
jgi:acetyltransferase-like isoleucine patch superfamily enzyme